MVAAHMVTDAVQACPIPQSCTSEADRASRSQKLGFSTSTVPGRSEGLTAVSLRTFMPNINGVGFGWSEKRCTGTHVTKSIILNWSLDAYSMHIHVGGTGGTRAQFLMRPVAPQIRVRASC